MREPRRGLVGRERERARLRQMITGTVAGRSSVVELLGEPGMGKTAVIAEATAMAEQHGVSHLAINFHQGEEELPLAALRRTLAPWDHSAARRQLERLFDDSGPAMRFMIVDAAIRSVLDVVEHLDPMVLVMEDCHWADPASLQVMRAVVRRTRDRGVATVIASRPLPRPRGLQRLMAMEGREGSSLTLSPLDTEELADLASRTLGASPGPRLRQQLALAAGNPLIAEEMLRELGRQDLLWWAHGTIPEVDLKDGATPASPDLDVHVNGRLAALSATAQRIVALCALSDLTADQLARLLDRPVADITDALAEAVGDGLVEEDGTQLHLRHGLLRDAVLAGITPGVVAGLHADLFRLFAAEGAGVERVVPHIIGSGDPTDESDLRTVAEAGRHLIFTAPAVAASLLRRAFVAGHEAARSDLAVALTLLGEVSEATRLLPEDGAADSATTAHLAVVTAQLDFLRGDLRWASRRFELVAPRLPADQGASALCDAGLCSLFVGQLGRAEQLALRAETSDPAAEQWAATGTSLQVRGWVTALRGDVARGLELTRKGHRLALQAPGTDADATLPDLFLAQVLLWNEELDEASKAVQRALVWSAERGTGWHLASLHAVQADIDIRRGRWDDADAHIDAALGIVTDVELQHGLPWCLAAKATMTIGRGEDPTGLLTELQHVLGRLGGQGTDRLLQLRGLLHLREGALAEAAQVLGFLWGRLDQAGMDLRRVQIAPTLMRAAVREDRERAMVVCSWLAEQDDEAATRRVVAVRLHAEGLVAADTDLLIEAARAMWQLNDPLEAARICTDVATLDAEALPRDLWERAASVLHAAGATAWLGALIEHQPLLEHQPPVEYDNADSAGPADETRWVSLTPLQSRIVYLVGTGLGNLAVAEQLAVTRRIVESQLRRACARLRVDSRGHLRVAAAQRIESGWNPVD